MTDVSLSIAAVMKPAGLEKSKGRHHRGLWQGPDGSPAGRTTPAIRHSPRFVGKYLTPNDLTDANAVYGIWNFGRRMVQVLKQCGNDLSRENVMKQAANIKDLELPMLLPGVKINTSPTNFSPIRQMQLASFDGESWELFGDLIERLNDKR